MHYYADIYTLEYIHTYTCAHALTPTWIHMCISMDAPYSSPSSSSEQIHFLSIKMNSDPYAIDMEDRRV